VKASQNEGVKLVLPYPPSELLPNKKASWQKKMVLTKQLRQQAFYEILAQDNRIRMMDSVSLTLTFYPPNGILADFDSLYRAFKPFQDALVDTHILQDDSPKVIKKVTLQMGKPDKEHPRTEIEIEEALR